MSRIYRNGYAHQRNDSGTGSGIHHSTKLQQPCNPRYLGLHIGQLLLNKLLCGERAAELLGHGILACLMPAELGGTDGTQEMPKRALFRQLKGPFRPRTSGSIFLPGSRHSSRSPVTEARRENLPSIFGAEGPAYLFR